MAPDRRSSGFRHSSGTATTAIDKMSTIPRTRRGRNLRDDALAIWRAGVDAVRSEQLVRNAIQLERDELVICNERLPLNRLERIAVVGAGKAGAGMASAVEEVLGEELVREKLTGWVNVPADCVRSLTSIPLHPARPAGMNEPTEAGVEGSRRILELVSGLTRNDLCLVLISGGGSALLPAPRPPLSLSDKQSLTRCLMHGGATIQQLNTVRKRLSLIKGGGLARASKAGRVIGLIISDIIGDPIDMIASGPTCPDSTTDSDALAVLKTLNLKPPRIPQRVLDVLEHTPGGTFDHSPALDNVVNHVIGTNAMAIRAAAATARELGYFVTSLGSGNAGEANAQGRALLQRCLRLREDNQARTLPACILSGGEPVVRLAKTSQPRQGGRNQQLVLAAIDATQEFGLERIVLLSGGTDGEDGPTDAAGAWADADVLNRARELGLDSAKFLQINDSCSFFRKAGGLLITGPTHTNVMDLRVALVDA